MKAKLIFKIKTIYKNNHLSIILMKVCLIFKKSKVRLIIGMAVSLKIRVSFGFLGRKKINSKIPISIKLYSQIFYYQLMSIKIKI